CFQPGAVLIIDPDADPGPDVRAHGARPGDHAPDFYRIQQARERKSQSHPRPEGKRLIGLQEEAPAAQVLAGGEEPLAIRQHDPQDEGQPGIDTLLLIRVHVWQGLDLARKIAGPAGTLAGGVFVDNRMIGALEAALPWRTPSS